MWRGSYSLLQQLLLLLFLSFAITVSLAQQQIGGSGTCGNGTVGNGICTDPTLCCNSKGYCGSTSEYCDYTGLTSGFTPAPTPVLIAPTPSVPTSGGSSNTATPTTTALSFVFPGVPTNTHTTPFPTVAHPNCPHIPNVMSVNLAYYQSSAAFRDVSCHQVLPGDIDVSGGGYTHLAYAFAGIDANDNLVPWESNYVQEVPMYQEFNGLKIQHPNVKTLITIGGWTFNNPGKTRHYFSLMARSPNRTAYFANSVVGFLQRVCTRDKYQHHHHVCVWRLLYFSFLTFSWSILYSMTLMALTLIGSFLAFTIGVEILWIIKMFRCCCKHCEKPLPLPIEPTISLPWRHHRMCKTCKRAITFPPWRSI